MPEPTVHTGFASLADDYLEGNLDLNRYLIHRPAATFFMRNESDSMIDAGIHPGDLLIVDRALDPVHNSVVIAVVNGDLLIRRYFVEMRSTPTNSKSISLIPANPNYSPIYINEAIDFEIWGVVIGSYHFLHKT